MAGKPKSMSMVKQLLILHQQGKGRKTIARLLGISKNTVKAYQEKLSAILNANKAQKWTINELIKLPEPELEAKFHPGNPAYKDHRFDRLKPHLDYYLNELTRVGVGRKLLWEEYRQQDPDGYSYSQFCFHLHQHLIASKPSMVLQHKPAEKLFIDFAGKKLSYADKDSGEQIQCHVFAASLPYSDFGFAMAVRTQSTQDFIHALTCCLQAIGGVPKALVPDNLKTAVDQSDPYEPDINRVMEDFANHYGAVVFPARVKKPRDKALVENQVKLVYSRVYARLRNTTFFDLQSLNQAIKEKMKAHNQTRMQRKPYCREEQFLAEEKGRLMPLPRERFQLKYYAELKVEKNNHVNLRRENHYYSVPYHLIGQRVKIIYTQSMVYIYHKGNQVAVHPRSTRGVTQSPYTTVPDHLCSQHQHYNSLSPDYYIKQARDKSAVLTALIKLIFAQDRYPEQLYKTCDGLLSLFRKSKREEFDKACQIAIDHQNYSYKFVKNILANKMIQQHQQSDQPGKPLPSHHNIRGKKHYQQLELNFNPKPKSNNNESN